MLILNRLAAIPLRNLFLVTVTCKILASLLAWWLSSPWILGFAIPLAFMMAYIGLGFRRPAGDVSDDKFGDSCYYLGFIFTISSIAFGLFDIPDLDKAGRLSDVAVRFGAAMVSTFLGFIVRVYLVGFRHDSTEAMEALEDQIVASANALKTRLELSEEAFRDFEAKTRQAASDAEARVQLAAENIGRHVSQEMAQALKAIAADLQALHSATAQEMKTVSQSLAADLTKCSQVLLAETTKARTQLDGFGDQLETRLRSVTFPDDYFTKELAPPLRNLVASVASLEQELKTLTASVNSSIQKISATVEKIDVAVEAPAKRLTAAMEKIEAALEAPHSVRELVDKQETIARGVLESMSNTGRALEGTASAIKDQNRILERLAAEALAAKGSQEQSLEASRQLVLEFTGAQRLYGQLITDLGRLIKQLEQLPADLRHQIGTASTIARSDAIRPPIAPIPPASAFPTRSIQPADTAPPVVIGDASASPKSTLFDRLFRRGKE